MSNIADLGKQYQELITSLRNLTILLIERPFIVSYALVCVIIIAVLYSVRQRLGNKVIDLADKLSGHLIMLGVRYYSNMFFSLRYRKHIIYEHRVFNVKGLRTQGTFTLEIENVYVNLKISPINNPNQSSSILGSNGIKDCDSHNNLMGNRTIWDFLQRGLNVLAIIGAPGCGKSTLLQHIALSFASEKHRAYKLPNYIPIFLFLREHIDKIVSEEDAIDLSKLCQLHFSNEKRYPNLKPTNKWFYTKLSSGKAIVLLDGLDEVADIDKRKAVSAWVDKQILAYNNCIFIVTSRPQGYLSAPLHYAHRLEILPFSWNQVKQFSFSWYLQNEILSFGRNDEGVRNKARQESADLLNRLKSLPALESLTVNPLLLTMIAMVHRYRGQLPGRRIELYSEICDVLLGHWWAAKGIENDLSAVQKRVAIEPLAAAMLKSETRQIATQQALDIIKEPLSQINIIGKEKSIIFLKEIEEGSGLISEIECDLWAFSHLSFQEYLTSCYLLDNKHLIDWSSLVNNTWWHETIRLYAAQSDPGDIIESCLYIRTDITLILASECLDEAKKLSDNSLRNSFHEIISTSLDSENYELRNIAAKVILNKRLKKLSTVEDIVIDEGLITCAEYQLFLNDLYVENKFYHPDCWHNDKFQHGQAKQPVVGVTARDSIAFCSWLNKAGGPYIYRLPSHHEMSEFTPSTSSYRIATWVINNTSYVLGDFKYKKNTLSFQCPVNTYYTLDLEKFSLSNISERINKFIKHVKNINSRRFLLVGSIVNATLISTSFAGIIFFKSGLTSLSLIVFIVLFIIIVSCYIYNFKHQSHKIATSSDLFYLLLYYAFYYCKYDDKTIPIFSISDLSDALENIKYNGLYNAIDNNNIPLVRELSRELLFDYLYNGKYKGHIKKSYLLERLKNIKSSKNSEIKLCEGIRIACERNKDFEI